LKDDIIAKREMLGKAPARSSYHMAKVNILLTCRSYEAVPTYHLFLSLIIHYFYYWT